MTLKNIEKLNALGKSRTPFLFIISFDKKRCEIFTKVDDDIKFCLDKKAKANSSKKIVLKKEPILFKKYKKAFSSVQEYIKSGHTYLLNLTSKSKIESNLSLKEIYEISDARFKLIYKDRFVCFSPERFIKIKDNTIETYPMKGTIDADIQSAKEKILANQKEMAEHTMVVDLLRNDLSMVSKRVRVEKFRYCEEIKAGDKRLLQVSSKIVGELEDDWQSGIGDILDKLLPAGSISGTPKKETIRIIEELEAYDREFYTGVFGYFDGESLDSAVMIRFIEKEGDRLFYKSGGGVTIDSDLDLEYQELIEKIYIPT